MTSKASPAPKRRLLWRVLIVCAVLCVLSIAAIGILYFAVAPGLMQSEVSARLDEVAKRAGVDMSMANVQPVGTNGVEIKDFEIKDEDGAVALKVKRMRVNLDAARLLTGDKVITDLTLEGLDAYVIKDARGQTNVERAIKRLLNKRAESSSTSPKSTSSTRDPMRYFGGEWPRVEVKDIQVHFISDKGAAPFPIKAMSVPQGTLEDGKINANVSLDRTGKGRWKLPSSIKVHGELTMPASQSTLDIKFDEPLRVSGLNPVPFLEVGLSGARIRPGNRVELSDLTLGTTLASADAPALAQTNTLSVTLATWPTSLSTLDIKRVELDGPSATIRFNAQGASTVSDLLMLMDGKTSKHVATTARTIATNIATPSPEHDSQVVATTVRQTQPLLKRLSARAQGAGAGLIPDTIVIRGATLRVEDARDLPVARPTDVLLMKNATLSLTHDPNAHSLDIEGGFKAYADGDTSRGSASVKANINYKRLGIEARVQAKALDLSWVAQLIGPKLSTKVRGGTVDVDMSVKQPRLGDPIEFEGHVALAHGHVVWPKLAEEPIEGIDVRYDLAGTLNPDAPVPAPKLLKPTTPKKPSPKDITPPDRGSLVFTRGDLQVGQVKAQVLPAVYGFDANKPWPARLSLRIKMPRTEAQTALSAIPPALLGELSRAQLQGVVSMNFHAEVPMYNASEMIWEGEPNFRGLAIVSLPSSMDVRKMTRAFTHTIEDKKVNYTRTIRIPKMTEIPAQWLMDNAGLSEDDVHDHWSRGGWQWGDAHSTVRERPWTMWSTNGIVRRWSPPSRSKRAMKENPYGTYVYVPLHHISPWLVRAILTTEDNSFFSHDGFNRHALRASIERNLNEGDYARGASTISMQLIKNLFLNRKKVMSRKIQEAILVYLMESVISVPKARLMELYLNVIEFAPGVFGIHDAAVHYFGKRPSDLTLAECAWLVTIVPGPKRHHRHYMRGEMSARFWTRMQRYMHFIKKRGRATEEEYQQAILLKPQFYKPKGPNAPVLRPQEIPSVTPSMGLTPDDIEDMLRMTPDP